jgi:hypothetical protein
MRLAVTLTPEELYLRLGSLVAEMPDLVNASITPETNTWMGRAAALLEASGDMQARTMLARIIHGGVGFWEVSGD